MENMANKEDAASTAVNSVSKLTTGTYRAEVDQELLEWTRTNLKNIPDDENYAKMISGIPYDTFHPTYLMRGMIAQDMTREYCNMKPEKYEPAIMMGVFERKVAILKELFGKTDDMLWLAAPFTVDFGFNVSVGKDFYANFNVCFLDSAPIIIGDEVIVGPNTTFVTASHPTDPEERRKKITFALPIRVKDRVWIGANVVILPGVTIGEDSTIAAGAIVREDVPPRTIVGGVPARVLKHMPIKEEAAHDESVLGFSLPSQPVPVAGATIPEAAVPSAN